MDSISSLMMRLNRIIHLVELDKYDLQQLARRRAESQYEQITSRYVAANGVGRG